MIGVTSWPATARLIRAQVLTVKQRLYVDRARALGAGNWHLTTRHILPNVAPLILANATLTVPIVDPDRDHAGLPRPRRPDRASWGKTLDEALLAGAISRDAWWYYLPAGLGIVAVVLALHPAAAGRWRRSSTRA